MTLTSTQKTGQSPKKTKRSTDTTQQGWNTRTADTGRSPPFDELPLPEQTALLAKGLIVTGRAIDRGRKDQLVHQATAGIALHELRTEMDSARRRETYAILGGIVDALPVILGNATAHARKAQPPMARLRNIQTIAQNAAQGAARAMGFGGQPAASATTPWWAQARQQQAQVVQEPDIFPESGVTNNHVPTLLQPGTKADAIPADVIADTAALAQAVLGANKVLTEVLYKLRADLEATADIQNTMVEVVGETDNDGLRAQVAAPAGPTLDEINSAVNAAFVPMVQRNQQLEAVIRALAEKLGLSVDQFLGAGQQGVVQTPPAAATVPILVAVAGTPTLVPAGGTPAASTGSSFMDAFRKGRQATASKP